MKEGFDRRLTPARADLAASHLKGHVEAARFVDGVVMQVKEGVVDVKREPRPDASLDTQTLYGECVTVYDEEEGWAWGQLARDNYVGWIAANTLWSKIYKPTHLVRAPMSAEVEIVDVREGFSVTSEGGFIFAKHLVEIGAPVADFVAVAETLMGAPYLWGGRSSMGVDCSGLVQSALMLAGIIAPRDSDLQQAQLGHAVELGARLQRGDLIFWKGHVGVMRDAQTLLHANATHMLVTSEPLEEVRARNLLAGAGDITAIKRLDLDAEV